ncbi:MAG: glycosyltransferase [Campylobacterales bacterium]|nr:glycosyltransferase [Campylobacterales bacterium]
MKYISIVTPCYNEQDNIMEVYKQVKEIFDELKEYKYEHIFIDNRSKDNTYSILKEIAKNDKNVKLIRNARNFGLIKSPVYGMLQASGDAIILLVADLQDPPSMIKDFLKKWEEGFKVVLGVKTNSEEYPMMFLARKFYYNVISKLSDVELTKNNTGFGLYDRAVIEIIRKVDDPYPYFRGLVSEIGFESAKIEYLQPVRKRGISSANFYVLYDLGMLGITSHTKVPLRIMTMSGFVLSILSFVLALIYLVSKLFFWDLFAPGSASILIGIFLFSSIQLFFLGIIGEYIAFMHTHLLKRPLVVEDERINFD